MERATDRGHGKDYPIALMQPIEKASYWRSQVARWPPLLDLPLDRPRDSIWSARVSTNRYAIAPNVFTEIRRTASRLGLPMPEVLLSCCALLLHRLARQNSIAIGYVPSAAELRSSTSMLPIVSEAPASLTLSQLLSGMQLAVSEAEAQAISYDEILKLTDQRADASRAGLVEVQFSFTEIDRAGGVAGGHASRPPADLSFDFRQSAGDLSLEISYNAAILDSSTIDRWARHFDAIAVHLGLPGGTLAGCIPLMDEADCERILIGWNQTSTGYPRDKTIAQVFADTAAASPDAIALSFGEKRLTYGELDARANQVAHGLRERGIQPGARVAASFERSFDSIISILGVLKAGGSYIPIDASHPDSRIGYMLADAAVEMILTSSAYLSRFVSFGFPLIPLDTEWPTMAIMPQTPPSIESSADDLAYVIYTSGSTGLPKGVLVPQRGILRLVRNTNYTSFNRAEVFLQLAPLAFDASLFEIFGALLNGLHLVIAPANGNDPEVLRQTILEYGVTTLWLTAAFFHLIAADSLEVLRPLRQVLAGGDALSIAHVRRVLEHMPHLRLINAYGPTENTTFTTFHPITRETLLATGVPIGRPIANSRVYILDALLQPLPVGIPGELCIGGDGLAFGYLNKPELTEERFLSVELPGVGLERLYRTGDTARYRPDGTIEFLGRTDSQIKIRGYRVELGEIETALEHLPQVSSAVVTVYEDPAIPGDKRLAAYIVPAAGAAHGTRLIEDIRRQLRAKLPSYMQPVAIMALDELPRTINGKVDRRNLPAPQAENFAKYVAPHDGIERQLVAIWEEVLDRKNIGIEDNFFNTDGYSLTIVRLFTRINKAFKTSLPITTIFNTPTIAQLADVLRGRAVYSALVPVQTQGTKPPLFLLHSYLLYGKLPAAIGADQPVYGLRELEGDEDITIRQRAAQYIAEMRKLQPRGPYYLAGWSAAGPITVEVSGQLSRAGEEVALTLVFDAHRPGYEEEMAAANKAARTPFRKHPTIEKLRFHADRLNKLPAEEKLVYLRAKLRRRFWVARDNFFIRHWRFFQYLSRRYGLNLPDFLYNVTYKTFAALVSHRGDPIPTRITLVRAAESDNIPNAIDDWGWSQLTTAGVDVFFAPGTHETMFRDPYLSITATIVRESIQRGGTALEQEITQDIARPFDLPSSHDDAF